MPILLRPYNIVDELTRRGFFAASAAAAALILGGCADRTGESASGNARDVEHALGTARIPEKPGRVVVAGDFIDLDLALAAGVRPVAYGFTGAWGREMLPWQRTAGGADLERFDASGDLDAEVIAGFEPDLIIGMKSYLEPIADALSKVAPVVALDWSVPWRDGINMIGQATFLDDEAANAVADTDELLAASAARLGGLSGRRIMVGSLYSDVLYVQGPDSSIGVLLRALGLNYVPFGEGAMSDLSLENVGVLANADILLSFATDPAATAQLEGSPLFQALPAVSGRAYAALPTEVANSMTDNFGPLSAPCATRHLEDLLPRLAAGGGGTLG